MTVPKIRFPGFTDDWEQRKFAELANIRRGLTYKPNDVTDSGIRVLRSSNINEDSFIENDDDVFVKESAVNISSVKDGDILITSANGSNRLVGKHAIISKAGQAVHGGFMLIASAYGNPYFLNASMSSSWYTNFVNMYVAGGNGAIGNLKKSDLENQVIRVPSEAEQLRIGQFFQSIDQTITLHQRKLESIKLLKKSLLQKMFPKNGESVPEVRFPGFTDAWEQRKLSGMATFSKGSGYSKADLKTSGKPIILYGRMYTKYETIIRNVDTFAEEKAGSVYSESGDVIVPASGETAQDISRASVVANSGILLGGDINIIHPNNELNPGFLALTISNGNQQKKLSMKAQGATIVHLHNEDLKGVDILCPSIDEQTLISEFFERIDNTITLHQRKVESLQKLKKSLLQQMFV